MRSGPVSREVRARHGRRAGRLLFAWIALFYVFTAGGSLTTTDAVVTYELTRQMVDHGSIALPGNMLGSEAHRGVDGRYYSPFGIAQSVVNVPFLLAARGLERLGLRIGPSDTLEKAAVAMGNTLVMATTIWVVYLFGWRLADSVHAGLTTALLAGLATPLWPYSKFGFNAPLSALFLTAAVFSAWRATRDSAPSAMWTGFWVSLALLTRHELVLVAVPILAYFWMSARTRSEFLRHAAMLVAGLLPALVGWLSYNAWRFGHPLDAGYMRDSVPGFGSSPLEGLYGLLLSPSTSLIAYCPLALAGGLGLVALWKRDRALAALLGGSIGVLLLFYAQLSNWMGGRSYGPRYLVPALPLLCVGLAPLLAQRRRPGWLAVLAVASLIIQFPGVLVDYAKVSVANARVEGAPSRAERLVNWQTSALFLNTRAAARLLPANVALLIGGSPPPAPDTLQPTARGEFSPQFAHSLDFWWMYLFHMRALSAAAVGGIVLTFVTTLSGLMVALRRSVHAYDFGEPLG
ncbi:MAG: glycosyltransferase family 39 protein [Vicinamibacteria bacterium]|nr:glycosyltransferase family 39 protein [Vicinamibacteria bacterium]